MESQIQTEIAEVGALIPYEFNNKIHGEAEVDRIANSIAEFGFTVPILVDEKNIVLAGHKRLLASKKLGLEKVPVIRKLNLTEAQKKAYRIIDNKSTQESAWDLQSLEIELKTIEEMGFKIDNFIIPDWSFDTLEDEEVEEDDFTETVSQTDFEPGDLIELGDHRILCGDSTKLEDVQKLMAGARADLLVTDPPYNVAYEGKTEDALTIQNDKMSNDDFLFFLVAAFKNAYEAMREGASYYVFHADSEGLNFRKALQEAFFLLKQTLIWNKNTMVLGRQDYQWKHEPILYGWKPGAAHYFIDDRTQTTVWDHDKPSRNAEHPTMKPIALVARCISNSSLRGGVVLDLFLGSGSTLIACEQLERKCYGIELDPKYVQVIVNRYLKYCEENSKDVQVLVNGELYGT